jgi:hypothetical protein
MKKIFASMGLAAAGTATLHAAYAPDVETGDTKRWGISGTLSGFYDTNPDTVHSGRRDTVGAEISPSFEMNLPLQQTELGMKYTYGLYYYQYRQDSGQDPYDQTHQFDLWVDHAFNALWKVRVQDTVVVAQEPEVLTTGAVSVPQRVSGNNIVNSGSITLDTSWSRLFSTSLSYNNTLTSYENGGATVTPPLGGGGVGVPPFLFPAPPGTPFAGSVATSYAGTLDRIDQSIGLELQWHLAMETVFSVGYSFGMTDYTGDEPVAVAVTSPTTYTTYFSDSRNSRSHTGYVGIQHNLLANLALTARAGVTYTDYYNDPNATSSVGPYGNLSLIYTYGPGCYAQLGFMQTRNATDEVGINSSGQITQDQESSIVYASINHQITSRLTGSVVGHFQYSTYNNGQFNSQSSEFYNAGVNLSYAFNRHLAGNVGYNVDYYTTPVPGQNYSRNRVYIGVTATY